MRKITKETVQPRAYSPAGAAIYTNTSTSVLAKRRMDGTGPRFIKHGAKISYLIEDLDAWLDTKPKHMTTTESETSTQKRGSATLVA